MSPDECQDPSETESNNSDPDEVSDVEPTPDVVVPVDVGPVLPPPAEVLVEHIPPPPLPPPAFPADDSVAPDDSQAEPVVRRRAIRGAGSRSFAYYITAHGKLTWYPGSGMFEAKCNFPGHGDCRVTKTRNAAKGVRLALHPHQGRYAACLVAWLELGSDKQKNPTEHRAVMPTFAARRAVRDRLKVAGVNAVALLDAERKKMDHESDSEPSDFEPFDEDK